MRLVCATAVYVLLAGSVSIRAESKHLPLPPQLLTANAVYIDNQSGEAAIGDRAFQEITSWGRFKVVTKRSEADLVFVLSRKRETVGATSNGGPDVSFFSGLTIRDAKTDESLWTDSRVAAALRKSAIKRTIDELRKRIEEEEKPKPQKH